MEIDLGHSNTTLARPLYDQVQANNEQYFLDVTDVYPNETIWNTSTQDSARFPTENEEIPKIVLVIITIMYATITILAIGGNTVVCYITLAYRRMRSVTNCFIANLAISDILMAILCIPFTSVANLHLHYWPFGAIMCPIVLYAQAVTVILGSFTLLAICLDRYVAIAQPFRQRLRHRQAALLMVGIWLLSLAVPLPVAILSQLVEDEIDPTRYVCREKWPDDNQRKYYTIALMTLQYFLPLCVLLFTYFRIIHIVWGKKLPGEAQSLRDQRLAKNKKKMVKMMMMVVIIYAVCWLPIHTITLVGDTHETIWDYPHIQVIWTLCHWLAMSNTCYNPMVYCWMNARYRNGFRFVFRCLPCVRYHPARHHPSLTGFVTSFGSAYSTNSQKTSLRTESRKSSQSLSWKKTDPAYTAIELRTLPNGCGKKDDL